MPKKILINLQQLVCGCTIALEMKVGSVQFSHFKSPAISFSRLLLDQCSSFSAKIVFDYLQTSAANAITTCTQLIDIENQILIFTPTLY